MYLKFEGGTTLYSVSGLCGAGDAAVRVTLLDEAGQKWGWRGKVPAHQGVGAGPLPWLWDLHLASDDSANHRRPLGQRTALQPVISDLATSTYHIETSAMSLDVQIRRVSQDVRVQEVQEDRLRGKLFHPTEQSRASVIVLGGSEGGIAANRAAGLADRGYTALALGYFDYGDRPTAALGLPLEYFAEAVRFLHSITGKSVVVWGASRGSEAAVLTAAHFPQHIAGVIAWAPSPVVNLGFDMSRGRHFFDETRPMWSLGGKGIAGVPTPGSPTSVWQQRSEGHAKPPGYRYTDEFMSMWQGPSTLDTYALPAQQCRVPLLAVAPTNDGLWPSLFGAQLLTERWAGPSTLVPLDRAGHAIGMPNEPRPFSHIGLWQEGYAGFHQAYVDLGGTPVANADGARKGWQSVISFIDKLSL